MKPRRVSDNVDGDSSVMKTCCCCMDVRLGTIVLGFCHLVGQISLSLSSSVQHPHHISAVFCDESKLNMGDLETSVGDFFGCFVFSWNLCSYNL